MDGQGVFELESCEAGKPNRERQSHVSYRIWDLEKSGTTSMLIMIVSWY